eukprot:4552597-Amphidinium_carterae.1
MSGLVGHVLTIDDCWLRSMPLVERHCSLVVVLDAIDLVNELWEHIALVVCELVQHCCKSIVLAELAEIAAKTR